MITIAIRNTDFNNIINCVIYLGNYILFLIPTITTAGTPRYIPMFSIITESPSDMTSDSDSAFLINDNELIIGVIAILIKVKINF